MAVHDLRQAGATESVTIHLLEQNKNKKKATIQPGSSELYALQAIEYALTLRSCVIPRHLLNLLNSAHSFP